MKHLLSKAVLLIALSLSINFLNGQTILDQTIPLASPCYIIVVDTKISFERGNDCSGNMSILYEGIEVLNIPSNQDTFSYKFDQLGLYRVFCGAPAPNDAATYKACFSVTAAQSVPTVPTMGEWGLMSLSLFLLIFTITAQRQGTLQFN